MSVYQKVEDAIYSQSEKSIFSISPNEITSLAIWIDASDNSTTIPTRGTLVSIKSKVNGYLFNSSVSTFPSIGINSLNGRSVLTFAGNGVASSTSINLGYPITAFIVARRTSNYTLANRVLALSTTAYPRYTNTPNSFTNANNNIGFNKAASDNIYNVIDLTQNGASSVLGINGIERSGTAGTLSINGVVRLGDDTSVGLYGNIGEVIIYKRALLLWERYYIIQYLQKKWFL